jgi:ribonucleoside-diphosphate reductase alpha chain
MALQYGVPLITLVDKFRHARFEPSGMTSNRDIPFAKSLIDYIFCWLGCQFIPGYADKNLPNRTPVATTGDKTAATARELVEKTKDLAHKIAEAKAAGNNGKKTAKAEDTRPAEAPAPAKPTSILHLDRFIGRPTRVESVVATAPVGPAGEAQQTDAALMQQFNAQFEHFGDDAPACDICGSITVRNGTCYKCFNCGNSMGCS